MEEQCLRRRLKHAQTTGKSYMTPAPMSIGESGPILPDEHEVSSSLLRLRNGQLQSGLGKRLTDVEIRRRLLGKCENLDCTSAPLLCKFCAFILSDKQRQTSSLLRNVIYPVAMILLLGLIIITIFMVLQNTVELLIGMKALPLSSRVSLPQTPFATTLF